ncbi:hypothetical protein X797_007418 [Metarhizium robertsii]|uniref:Uncharacterized protein n=1 Tax=Metarhizium robertsii TaxID=568076 RepID=A0A014ND97_9HYPO|nr:hypothetical protein X797_007418 [Metarhizium robertsii]
MAAMSLGPKLKGVFLSLGVKQVYNLDICSNSLLVGSRKNAALLTAPAYKSRKDERIHMCPSKAVPM